MVYQTIYQKCSRCGRLVKDYASYQNEIYGTDCWNIVASEFIEKRDAVLDSITYENQSDELKKLDKLSKQYGVA